MLLEHAITCWRDDDDDPEPELPVWWVSCRTGAIYRTESNGFHTHPRGCDPRRPDPCVALCDIDDDIAAIIDARPQRDTREYEKWRAAMLTTLETRLVIKRALWVRWRAREEARIGEAA